MSNKQRGKCRLCGNSIIIRKDGTLRSHLGNTYDNDSIFRMHCNGSGQKMSDVPVDCGETIGPDMSWIRTQRIKDQRKP